MSSTSSVLDVKYATLRGFWNTFLRHMHRHNNESIHLKSVILGLILILLSTNVDAQFGEKGLLFSLGVGTGYSSHADSYQVVEPTIRVREFPGFRIFILESKLGWTFGEQLMAYVTGNIAPGNTTISPYRSFYAGAGMAYSPSLTSSFYFKGGAGYSKAAIEKGKNVGTGVLTNLGIGFELGDHFYLEINTYFGELDEENYLDPNPFLATDIQFNVMISYAIF